MYWHDSNWETGIMTHNGPLVQRFEKETAEKLGVPNLVSCVTNTGVHPSQSIELMVAMKVKGVVMISPPLKFIARPSSTTF